MHIQSKRHSYAMSKEAAAKIAAENEKMSLVGLKVKNMAVMSSIRVIKSGMERALMRYRDMSWHNVYSRCLLYDCFVFMCMLWMDGWMGA